MQGINILSQSDVRECSIFGVIGTTAVFILLFYMFLAMCFEGAWKDIPIIMIPISIVVILFGYATYGIWTDYNTIHTEYKVTIDGSVSFNNFANKYQILNQDGQIFTIEEKE